MIFLLAAEMLVGAEGMGYRIRMESRVLNMSIVYIYLVASVFTGLLGDCVCFGYARNSVLGMTARPQRPPIHACT